jgi:hypothetical protein
MTAREPGSKAQHLQRFLQDLPDFPVISDVYTSYLHMGATVTDAVLQAGLNFQSTVKPRVERVLRVYPEARTTAAFNALVDDLGAGQVMDWSNPVKQQRLLDLLALLTAQDLQTEEDLRVWLTQAAHRARLQTIKGIKKKTCHYLQILCGDRDAVAVDVNLRTAFARAGLKVSGDDELADVVRGAAALMAVTPAGLDAALWTWVASRST